MGVLCYAEEYGHIPRSNPLYASYMRRSFILYFLLGMMFLQITCTNPPKSRNRVSSTKIEFVNHSLDTVTSVKNIPLDRLIDEYGSLNGQTVETEGIVYFEFENVAICPEKGDYGKC